MLSASCICFRNLFKRSYLFHKCTNTSRLYNLRNVAYNIRYSLSTQSSYNVNTNVVKDIILYKYDNPKFFRILNIFALCQFGFWAYLSHFAFTTLKNVPVDNSKQGAQWWRRINLGESKYRYGLTIISFTMGYGILAAAWMYSLKSVRYLILRKGGNAVTFVTYGPFGKNRMMTVDLKYISSKDTRESAKTYLPIKVKNQFLHYLLDMKGEFRNTKLFDYTAGLKRNLAD